MMLLPDKLVALFYLIFNQSTIIPSTKDIDSDGYQQSKGHIQELGTKSKTSKRRPSHPSPWGAQLERPPIVVADRVLLGCIIAALNEKRKAVHWVKER